MARVCSSPLLSIQVRNILYVKSFHWIRRLFFSGNFVHPESAMRQDNKRNQKWKTKVEYFIIRINRTDLVFNQV